HGKPLCAAVSWAHRGPHNLLLIRGNLKAVHSIRHHALPNSCLPSQYVLRRHSAHSDRPALVQLMFYLHLFSFRIFFPDAEQSLPPVVHHRESYSIHSYSPPLPRPSLQISAKCPTCRHSPRRKSDRPLHLLT